MKLDVRMRISTYAKIKKQADKDLMSMNSVVLKALEKYFESSDSEGH